MTEDIKDETGSEPTQLKSAAEKAAEKANELIEKNAEDAVDERPAMDWPVPVYPLVAKFDVQPVVLEDDQHAIVIALYTGAGAAFGLMTREGALQLSSRLRKVANGAK